MALLKLLSVSKSVEIRKKIIKNLRAPYPPQAMAFLGRRMRDTHPDVVTLIFKQLTINKTQIKDFNSAESRMLILTEGLTS